MLIRYFYPLHSDLPAGSQERSGKLHQEALHQVYLPHGILPDLPLPPAAGLTAHCPHQPAHAGTPAHYCRVDDSPMGAWYVNVNVPAPSIKLHFILGAVFIYWRKLC